jgi:hypothetical protein
MASSEQLGRGNVWATIKSLATNRFSGPVGTAKFQYDFSLDGGAIGLITPGNSPIIPAKAIILGGTIDVTTALTSGGSATIALGLSAGGGGAAAILAATAVASWTAGITLVTIPKFTTATYIKMTADGRMTLTVATAALLTGVFNVNLVYVMGE